MSDNWIVQNLNSALSTWSEKMAELWTLLTENPATFKGGGIWRIMTNINDTLTAIAYGLLVLFFAAGIIKTCGSFTDLKKPEHVLKAFIRFALAQGAITYGMELMQALFSIVQGIVTTVMSGSSMAGSVTELPTEIVDKIESVGMLESIPLWIVTAWQSADYCIVICNDSDSVWQNVQNLYVYSNRPDSDFLVCRRTHAVHRKELYPFIYRRVSGRGNYCTGVYYLFCLCGKSSGSRRYGAECSYNRVELCRRAGIQFTGAGWSN